ncbi:hypothetical protein Bra471DRAFT_02133 [Bradyrhizobium sp. WSM471]|nr:hypothetical protein Bra471DRAFT_02133 [Bradyrhizobium sp. WSM471]
MLREPYGNGQAAELGGNVPCSEYGAMRTMCLAVAVSQIWVSATSAKDADSQVACAATAFKN